MHGEPGLNDSEARDGAKQLLRREVRRLGFSSEDGEHAMRLSEDAFLAGLRDLMPSVVRYIQRCAVVGICRYNGQGCEHQVKRLG